MLKGNDLLYHRIEKYLEDQISSGTLKPGDKLLSERKIGELFDASLIPVRRAMEKFLDTGVLEKVQGKGTFVRRVPSVKPVRTGRIGVVYSHSKAGFFASPFYATIFTGIEEQANLHKQSIIMRSLVAEFNDHPARTFDDMAPDVDGFVVVDLTPAVYADVKEALAQVRKPVVILNYEDGPDGMDRIVTASRDNTARLVQHLTGLGHRRIACLFASHDGKMHANFLHRVQGFRDTMEAAGLPVGDDLMIDLPQSGRHGDLADRLLTMPDRPTAVVCCGTFMATRYLMPQLQEKGLTVPDDLSIVVYDDLAECSQTVPPLTAINTSLEDLGRLGMKRLEERIDGTVTGTGSGYEIVLPGELVVRGSTAPLKAEGMRV